MSPGYYNWSEGTHLFSEGGEGSALRNTLDLGHRSSGSWLVIFQSRDNLVMFKSESRTVGGCGAVRLFFGGSLRPKNHISVAAAIVIFQLI
jgi:hypothetical protein